MKLEEEGQEVPALKSKPEMMPDLVSDYMAFCQLQATRTVGFGGAEPIKLTEILAYMQMFGIDSISERKFFMKRIHMIDSIYMEIQQENQPKK